MSVVAYPYPPPVFSTINGAALPSVKTTTAPSLGVATPAAVRSATVVASIGL